ncbi:hypothetical protein [Tissierella carlieri]|nr:hypothetical protein [Tissierella carlieri]
MNINNVLEGEKQKEKARRYVLDVRLRINMILRRIVSHLCAIKH